MSCASPLPRFDGFGVGLRVPHYPDFLEGHPPVDFVEVISENFMVDGGRPLDVLARVRERYPVALHGVSMNIGGGDGVDRDYLRRLHRLATAIQPLWVSDHLCWTAVDGFQSHDLLPLPYTREALDVVADNVGQAQDILQRPLVLENPSTYVAFAEADMDEAEFLDRLCARTGCHLLLDVNNLYVSAANHGLDPTEGLGRLPLHHVRQVHLAGHSVGRDRLVDTHDAPVADPVWALYARVMERLGEVAVMIERDDNLPPLPELLDEVARARDIAASVRRRAA
ncbi:MNIO family bufferin maturase [Luteibacter sahnii]|uniref:MNIO family bufferin maturase n=1 Tax=Luteibacter sahnii TaxID=3021977 RepID=UPI002A6AFA3B|nr:DUF692 domain-containing protein [Luteibacter sp. PPL193]MDY1548630.1 DUF692 domain-containing protein [Luteibacter sp. PPL193]